MARNRRYPISRRERHHQVERLVNLGLKDNEIAQKLGLHHQTVAEYRRQVFGAKDSPGRPAIQVDRLSFKVGVIRNTEVDLAAKKEGITKREWLIRAIDERLAKQQTLE